MSLKNKIICAIDTDNQDQLLQITRNTKEYIGMAKLGLQYFCKFGPKAVDNFYQSNGLEIFLDLKLFDIPNTVAKAVEAVNNISGVKMLTLHGLGGAEMMQAAKSVINDDIQLLTVSILTSMSQQQVEEIGINNKISDQVLRLADLSLKSGINGMVCSGHEIKMLKDEFGKDITLVVPGIRPKTADNNDQKRVLTPKHALDLGADYLVIGRPITAANNMQKAAKDIIISIS